MIPNKFHSKIILQQPFYTGAEHVPFSRLIKAVQTEPIPHKESKVNSEHIIRLYASFYSGLGKLIPYTGEHKTKTLKES